MVVVESGHVEKCKQLLKSINGMYLFPMANVL